MEARAGRIPAFLDDDVVGLLRADGRLFEAMGGG
jgi:hypothetical protein